MKWSSVLVGAVLFGCVSTASAQEDRPLWGIKLGVSFFTSGEVRDALGQNTFSIGLSTQTRGLSDQWNLVYDLDVLQARRRGNRLLLVPLTVGVMRGFATEGEAQAVPYVAARVGAAYADYSITRPSTGIRHSSQRLLPTANVEAGVIFDRRFRLSARYDWFANTDQFSFSGLKLSAAYEFVRF
ncbi:MAG TPA: hypothetical protein VEX38_00840 [Fimbriimonadaceae bacterium]|nr:hypothetical protein [Fimbriimonadaceae bacterium]